MKNEEIKAFFARNKCKVFITLIGLAAAVLMLSIGFFRTLLILLLTGVCFFYGSLIDKHGFKDANKLIADFFRSLFHRN
ncbi:MAG: DUF2273 domain-containing protein [Clostridia bacterium]|jgi:uncharacterized membrane protein|nr:DUF2273 domain-containing protein [Clostridia bacterium]